MPSQVCPTCQGGYNNLLEHIRKKHPAKTYTNQQLQPLGLVSCPYCATACRGLHGIRTHSAKIHGIEGRAKMSTLPRPRTYIATRATNTLTASQSEPCTSPNQASQDLIPSYKASLRRKRPARTPSPDWQRPSQRQRHLQPTLDPQEDLEKDPEEDPTLDPLPRLRSGSPGLPTLDPLPRSTSGPQEDPSLQPNQEEPTLQPNQEEPSLEQLHNQAIAPILERAPIKKLLAFSKVPIPEKRLHARQAVIFTAAAYKAAEAFLKRPTERALLHFLLLPRLLGLGLQKGGLGTLLRSYPTNIPTLESLQPLQQPQNHPKAARPSIAPSPAQRATKLVERGYLGRAARALIDPTPVAPNTAENRAILLEKHPIGSRDPFQGKTRPRPGQPITPKAIIEAIRSIGKEKAPGLSGWTRPLLDLVVAREDSPIIAFLRLLADMIRQGTAPGADLLCASRLIGLEKPGGGVRPIAIGDLIYKVAMKAILMTSYRSEMLLPFQLGVNSPGGVEPAIFLLEEAILGPNSADFQQLVSIDLANAFNSVDRASIAAAVATYAPTFYKAAAWAYNNPSLLVTEDGYTLASSKGVRQDPALNGTLEAARKVFSRSPFQLNLTKSKEIAIRDLKEEGIKALGSFIGPIAPKRAFLEGKIRTLQEALTALQDLPKQHALLLLRGSIQLLLRHLQRQLDPIGLEDLWEEADCLIRQAIIALLARSPSDCPKEPSPDLIALPVREGGLGIPLHKELATQLHQAAMEASEPTLEKIRKKPPIDIGPRLGKTAQEVLKEVNQARLQSFLQDLPTSYKQARLENTSYLGRTSRYFYDIQIVAISKDSAREDPYSTLTEAAEEKRRKYKSLGAFFQPIIISAGGLMDLETAKTYKKLQQLVGPLAAAQLDATIGLTLTRTRAISAASIAKEIPAGLARSAWNTSRRSS
ncbi:hypothetical protein FocTR4_00012312 [Fusarium oxysporum f. sp. cubense]|uniref:Uncharacterized protein n=1 Tax=Fusarium oxysporum f. sp. cubense TaxID=61366 RepID=A0A5C6SJU6_FUSOC|nr:hypothetical protein FocTR4_00012312 [Fusarium oxysporum f. sp. cubense]